MTKRLHLGKENLVYLILWLAMFLTPVLSQYTRTMHNSGIAFSWNDVFSIWRVYAVYLALFLLHNFLLAPLLVHKHKKVLYFATTLCLMAVFLVYHCTQHPARHLPPASPGQKMEMKHNGPLPPPDAKPPMPPRDAPPTTTAQPPQHPTQSNTTPPQGGRPNNGMPPPLFFGQMDVVETIVLVLLLGMNIGIKLYFKSDERLKQLRELEKKNLEQQLEYLKFQINPHFFMNTLNNIHALVDIEPEKAKDTILELSKLMRYVLYEGAKQTVPLSRDIQFLNNYIALMRLRFSDKVVINFLAPESIPDTPIPPMLFITFVENAFKHGVSYQKQSIIHINLDIDDEHIRFACQNNKHPETTAQHGGVGLANVKQRLNLIYGNLYDLNIEEDEQQYNISLTIPTQTPNTYD